MHIKTLTIKTTFLPPEMEHGWGNGYIGVPPEHPWFNIDYDFIDCNVHGGLTYGENHAPKEKSDGYWWIGFDTCHFEDTIVNCPESYVIQEVESLKQQALERAK